MEFLNREKAIIKLDEIRNHSMQFTIWDVQFAEMFMFDLFVESINGSLLQINICIANELYYLYKIFVNYE